MPTNKLLVIIITVAAVVSLGVTFYESVVAQEYEVTNVIAEEE